MRLNARVTNIECCDWPVCSAPGFLDTSLSHAAGLIEIRRATPDELERGSGSRFFRRSTGHVEFDEVADGIPQLRDVAVDATMDDLFLQCAIEPLGDVGLGLGDEGVGRLDAPKSISRAASVR